MAKKSLLIGINYIGTPNKLRGCHNDIKNVKEYLLTAGFSEAYMSVLLDSPGHTYPTKKNIIMAMKNLVSDAKVGDFLYIHYSGHGSSTRDWNGDEVDGKDELICSLDGFIVDDELFQVLIADLPEGVKLRVVFDCCHSGSALDLCYRYMHGNKLFLETKEREANKDVILLSGCKDAETSADAYIEKDYTGALTWAYLKSLKFGREYCKEMNWKDLLLKIRFSLKKGGYTQVPQLSTCNKSLLNIGVDLF